MLKTKMTSTFRLSSMFFPQLQKNIHGMEIIGNFFFDENAHVLRKGDTIGEQMNILAQESSTGSAKPKNMIEVGRVGYFQQLYAALSENSPDLVIKL